MKLLTKTNQIYLGFSLVIYLLTALVFYQIIRLLIYDEVESRLRVERRDFETYVRAHNTWTDSPYFVENKIEVVPVSKRGTIREAFTDTLIKNRYDDKLIPFRQLTFYEPIQGVIHRVSIRKSLIQTYRLIEVISVAMVLFLGLLLLGMFWFQRKLSGRLWLPFYDTLSRIKRFDLNNDTSLELDKPEITEFNELNDVLQKMAAKMQQDYRSLKEFTENASHEMQTPLALINAKVEQLIQTEQLTETQTNWIETIYQASRRISRLNQGLLLLAKIENRQFNDTHIVDLASLLTEKLADMDEVLSFKQLSVQVQTTTPFAVQLPSSLADSLVTNLVNNAIKHNQPNGHIELTSTAELLCLSNTGGQLVSDPERLFERFKKESTGPDSVGLGLAIVRQICDSYGLQISYRETGGIHQFCISRID
ncbi:HAMP domain-containing histidine kinase [Spirosoma sp. KCTC 42546]|uniref:sensor histidine kinase n=1 Tax=Spirosoma sp. KCTC 42546 TaxID=2520506 RepID=UPI00115C1C2E|nr:HAMP domain-containing sensor histidine kinase [Spirosoma sp. KCTC 42546]QDK81714.1 HAMP domain-containing histidine kinase [Spirosoma sp. KCTC 42546]